MIVNSLWDFYQDNTFDVAKLQAAGAQAVGHKVGSWPSGNVAADALQYRLRKEAWQKTGRLWFCYFLPFSHQSSQHLFEKWMSVESDPNVAYAIDWEDDGSGVAASQEVIENLAMRFYLRFGWWPLLYGSNTITESWPSSILAQCPIWYAQPQQKGTPAPAVFAPKHEPAGFDVQWWQWTQDGDPLSDALGGADGSAFDGTQEEFVRAYPKFLIRKR